MITRRRFDGALRVRSTGESALDGRTLKFGANYYDREHVAVLHRSLPTMRVRVTFCQERACGWCSSTSAQSDMKACIALSRLYGSELLSARRGCVGGATLLLRSPP